MIQNCRQSVLFGFCLIFGFTAALGGCVEGLPPGDYVLITDIRNDPTPHILYEHGNRLQLYGADAQIAFIALFLPFEGSMTSVHLFDHPVQSWEFWNGYAMLWMWRQRDMGEICELAEGISPVWQWGETPDHSTVRWVLGNDPLIIAVGTDIVPVRVHGGAGLSGTGIELGMTYAMVQEEELDRTASEVIILDKWPPEWKNTGSEWKKQFIEDLAKVKRTIKFDNPVTLREIMEQRLWERATRQNDGASGPTPDEPVTSTNP